MSANPLQANTTTRSHARAQLEAIEETLGRLAVQDTQNAVHVLGIRLPDANSARAGRAIVRGRLQQHHKRIALSLVTTNPELAAADEAHRLAEVEAA